MAAIKFRGTNKVVSFQKIVFIMLSPEFKKEGNSQIDPYRFPYIFDCICSGITLYPLYRSDWFFIQ